MSKNGQKTILMLGGSMQQVLAIQKAKDLGYRTVLIDYLSDNPGQYVADKWYQESTTDVEAVYRIAKEENVSGILPYASDPAALPAAIVCERLGLPTNPAKSVEILGVKHKFRKFLQENGFPCPKTYIFSPSTPIEEVMIGIQSMQFPIVIKPTDSSGSKGVTFLKNADGVKDAICHADEYSRNKILIAEEFIERGYPYVIGGDIFVEDGKIVLLGQMACMRENNGHDLIPIGKRLPSGINSLQEAKIREELQRLINLLFIKSGEMNLEIILDKNDNVHFLELGPRAGGNMIPVQLSDAYKVNLIECNILSAMGEKVSLISKKPDKCYYTYVLHSDKDGVFSNINYSDEINGHIYRKVIYKKAGDKIEPFDGAGKAIGILFLQFDCEKEMLNMSKNMSEHIKIILSK